VSQTIENLKEAQKRAMAIRPKVGGFPYLAETLRRAGVTRNFWQLPACQSLYLTKFGPVVELGTPLVSAPAEVPPFNQETLIRRCEPTRQARARFRGSWLRHGGREWCATRWISQCADVGTTERRARSMWRTIPLWNWNRRSREPQFR
jgi:uncharacterized protein YbcV (DUF1398 family)